MAAAGLESPGGAYPDSLGDQDDVVYPCKGCGEILEEGKAFELAGNRWHIDCFRCNTCGTLLDSDANLLLLGDGSLICNNCTYSCNACGNKIEDLAILTGDQAFCASCFRCRNCKRKIENLRYARTSQGIFCMSCHETLMARRRKKAKSGSRQAQTGASSSQEKALPSLPSGVDGSVTSPSELEAPLSVFPEIKLPQERSDRSLPAESPSVFHGSTSSHTDVARKDNHTPSSNAYDDIRASLGPDGIEDGEESGYLPMAFDPSPVPRSVSRKQVPRAHESSPLTQTESQQPHKDYFGNSAKKHEPIRDAPRSITNDNDATPDRERREQQGMLQEKGDPSRSSGSSTPHNQGLGTDSRKNSTASAFKLQEAPKVRKPGSAAHNSPRGSATSPALDTTSKDNRLERNVAGASPASIDSQHSGVNPFDDPKRRENTSFGSSKHLDKGIPSRGDSLPVEGRKGALSANNNTQASAGSDMSFNHTRTKSTTSIADSNSALPSKESQSRAEESDQLSVDVPPPRNASRPSAAGQSTTNGDFTAPRVPPAPPAGHGHRQQDSVSSLKANDEDSHRNSGLPKHNVDSPFSMEEEMARILRGDRRETSYEKSESSGHGMLRRVSNAVKHGRSFSDRVPNIDSRSPPNGSQIEISSPITAVGGSSISSPTSQSALDQLRGQLKRAHQRIAELEADKNGLQEKFDSSAQISAASRELSDKRNTMVVLDAQREMVVAELESMTKHLKRAKDSSQPLDLNAIKSNTLKEFSEELQKIKEQASTEIERLITERNALTDEIGQLIQMKDKGFQEYESVSAKNTQLLELNAQLVHNIQEMYKAGAQANSGKDHSALSGGTNNGLGIYGSRTLETPVPQADHAEPAAMVSAPQVVDIRKGQVKKFNWRKGGEKVAKNVTRGIKGMLAGDQPPNREGTSPLGDIGLPYHMTQTNSGIEQNGVSSGARQDMSKGGDRFGFFNQQQKNSMVKGGGLGNLKNNSSTNLSGAVDASVLFGSELEARCDYEKRVVPSIVSRCVEEVELRGMLLEGIYRKSGGSTQVKMVQQGFEKDGNFDISDDDLDIHSVTSTLKQYLRKLPTPLITFDVYDLLLEAGLIQDREKQVAALRAAIVELPDAHRNCMEYLFQHLARVVRHENDNLMTPLNISVVFAPTIMRPLSIEREMGDMQAQRQTVQAILEHQRAIFGDS